MVRRTALPDAVTAAFAKTKHPEAGGDYGWKHIERTWAHMPAMAACIRRDAELARGIAITRDSHPAYPQLLREYQANGVLLGQLRHEHRRKLREASHVD